MQLAVKCILQVNYILLLKAYLLTFMLQSIIIVMALCVEPQPHQSSLHVPLATTSFIIRSAERLHMHVTQRYLLYPPIMAI